MRNSPDELVNWKDILVRAVSGETVSYEELVEAQAALLETAGDFGHNTMSTSDPNVRAALDIQLAMSLIEETDPAIPWNRAVLLESLGKYAEAADASLAAHAKFVDRVRKGTSITDDEEEWADTAIYHACRNLILAGQPIAATILSQRLVGANLREEIEVLLQEVLESS
jgi:hypothetical protein